MEGVDWIVLCFFCMSLTWINIKGDVSDPCIKHSSLDTGTLGSRNEKCPRPVPAQRVCDFRLEPAWYTIPFDGHLLDTCPSVGGCGTDFPVWLNGTLPSEADGVVNRTCCIKRDNDCCAGNVDIQVKKCTANKYVYYLPSLQECDSVYCMETNLPCEQTTTSTTTTSAIPTTSTQPSNVIGSSELCDASEKLIRILIGVSTGALVLLCVVSGVCIYLVYKIYCRKNNATVHVPAKNAFHHTTPG